MATYCTVRDVRIALTPEGVEQGQPRGETGAILPDWQITDAINEAEGLINAYVAKRYVITPEEVEEINPENPGETWVYFVAPSPLRGWTRNIAAWLATLTYRKNKDIGEDDPVRLRFNMTMASLTSVKDHSIDLALPINEVGTNESIALNLYDEPLFQLEDFNLGYGEHVGREWQRLWPSRVDGSYGP